jgi:hypothetical protein
MLRGLRALARPVLLAVLALPACSSPDTAARLIFDFDATVQVEQIRIQVVYGGEVVATADLPQTPAAALSTGIDVVVLFEDALAGRSLAFYAAGLHAGAEVATGHAAIALVKGETRTGHITLQATACGQGRHDCDGQCFAEGDPAHCGVACLACPAAPAHGSSSCTAGGCVLACDDGYTPCGDTCADVTGDAANCGTCGHACASGELCQQGTCQANTCGADAHPCGAECVYDRDPAHCGSSCTPCPAPTNGTATCDGTACGVACSSGYHACGGACVGNSSPATCGTLCTPCPTPANGYATCTGTSCGIACNDGYHNCSGACVSNSAVATCGISCTPCAAPANGYATCDGMGCGAACNSGYHDCSGACASNTSPSTCGTSCTPCSAPTNGYATCNGTSCGHACSSGYHDCSGVCASSTSPSTCGTSCTPCSTPTNGYATCNGTSCGIACNSGYHNCSGACASNTSPSTCGTSCTPCSAPTNGYATCNGTSCGIACNSGYHVCGSACASNTSPSTCGTSCTPCPAPTNGYATCDGSSCGWACNSGYKVCGNACIPNAQTCATTPVWTQVYPTHSPTGRGRGGFAYDSDRGVIVLFGGVDRAGSNMFGDTWEWNGADWSQPSLLTSPPVARAGAGFAYDPVHHVMVLFGGENSSWVALGDTWTYNGSSWTQVATTGPSARVGVAMAWDATAQKIVLFGGVGSAELNDTWEWNGTSWTQRTTTGAPSGRNRMGGIFDAGHNGGQLLVFGGETGVWTGLLAETWALRGAAWTQLAGGPPARVLTGFAYDSSRAIGILFGGWVNVSPTYYGDTWRWDGSAWSQLSFTGTPPAAMFGPQLAYDVARDRVVLFGGSTSSGDSTQTWQLSWQ